MNLLKKKNTSLLASLILVASAVTIASSYFFIHKENSRSTDFKSNLDGISLLSQLNTKWVSSVEETRNFALRDFDKIALYTKKIRANLDNLDSSGLLKKEKVGESTVAQYKIFKISFEIKNEAIERYKSEQAVLRNSANFLQTSANDALANVENEQIKGKITHTASILNTFLLLNNPDLEKEAHDHLNQLELYSIESESTLGKEAIRTYISHAKIILEYNPRVIQMLEAAKDVDIDTLTKNVSSSYLSYQSLSTDTVNYWRKILFGGALGLLLALLMNLNRSRKDSKSFKVTEEKLQVANTRINTVSDDIIHSERIAGRAHLALATLNTIQNNTPPIINSIHLLKNLIGPNTPQTSKKDISNIIADLEYQQNELNLFNEAILSDDTKSITSFDVNQLLSKAIKTVKSETNSHLNFKSQLERLLLAKNNPVAIFQIFLKLLRLTIHAATYNQVELDIQLRTWETDNYINMYMSISGHDDLNEIYSGKGMTVLQELIDQNYISIKITTFKDNNGTITLKLPKDPLNKTDSVEEAEEPISIFFEEAVSPA